MALVSFFLAIGLLFAIVFVFGLYHTRKASAGPLDHLPGPPSPHFLWGNEWQLQSSSPGKLYSEWRRRYGLIYKIHGALGKSIVCINDATAVRHVLGESRFLFPKPPGARAWFKAIAGPGLLYVEEKQSHRQMRKLVSPGLSKKSVSSWTHEFQRTASKAVDSIEYLLNQTGGAHIDFSWWSACYVLEAFCRAGFNVDFDAFSLARDNDLIIALDQLTNSEHHLLSFALRAFVLAFPSVLRIPSMKRAKMQQAAIHLDSLAKRILEHEKSNGESMLSCLISNAENDDNNLLVHIKTLISAAFETPSSVITWMVFELARNQELQDALRDELSGMNSKPSGRDNGSKVFDAVYRETLRLHSPVSVLHHIASCDVRLPISESASTWHRDALVVPKGTIIAIPLYSLHTDEAIWGTDAEEFKPERWYKNDDMMEEIWTFSHGPRSCPGRHFAYEEVKAFLSALVGRFSWSVEEPIEAFQTFVVRTKVAGDMKCSLPVFFRQI